MFNSELRIPRDRVAIIIGKQGEIKRSIEQDTETKIEIDSHEGIINISGEDALKIYTATNIAKAIGRGFNPEISLKLLKPEYMLELVSMVEYSNSKKGAIRIKGRVIGKEGKSRRTIEYLTDTNISVYGKTVAIIGQAENVTTTRKAIEQLLKGSPHAKVFKWLEKKRRDQKQRDMQL